MRTRTVVRGVSAAILAMALAACVSTPVAPPQPEPSALEQLSMSARAVSDYLNETLPSGNLLVFLNIDSDSEELSDFLIDELIANAVNDRVFTVVDRQQLEAIRAEQDFQMSGDVDDATALSIGRFLGAQTIVSGRVSSLGGHFRLTIRALDVQTAQVQGQYNRNIGTEAAIVALIGGGRAAQAQPPAQVPAQQVAQAPAQQTVQVPAQAAAPEPAQQAVVVVEGETLAERLQWLEANAANNTVYSIVLTADESIIPQTLAFPRVRNVTVRISGDGTERVLSLPGSGALFTVEADVTLVLDSGVTLQGRSGNNAPLVVVNGRGELIMNDGARITGNTSSGSGGGVTVNEHGIFTMLGGEIYGNTTTRGVDQGGGGVFVGRGGRFVLSGGIIHNNTASAMNGMGGGVLVRDAEFSMTGGEISGNAASSTVNFNQGMGGGVAVIGRSASPASFSMTGGEIFGNAAFDGAGVFLLGPVFNAWPLTAFTMSGGEISGNTASRNGGGVFLSVRTTFTKSGGVIHGMAGTGNDNRAGSSGHAVVSSSPWRYRNTTAGPTVRMASATAGAAGGWEN